MHFYENFVSFSNTCKKTKSFSFPPFISYFVSFNKDQVQTAATPRVARSSLVTYLIFNPDYLMPRLRVSFFILSSFHSLPSTTTITITEHISYLSSSLRIRSDFPTINNVFISVCAYFAFFLSFPSLFICLHKEMVCRNFLLTYICIAKSQ